MAKIIPFRGVLYNREKIHDLKDVVTPPYDVISERQRQEYFERHPQNVIRLILSKADPQDTEYNNRYTRAAEFFHRWLNQGILVQDTEPAFYVTEMVYRSEGLVRSRLGFIALVRLEDFENGGILPHEKTFSATKADRLKLMEACKANLCPIFSVLPDSDGEIVGPLRAHLEGIEPDFEFEEVIGYRHRLWRITDQQVHKEFGQKLAGQSLYIADGHHRYETALKYRNQIMSKQGTFDPKAPYNFVMMYLSSMNDPGLIIRPVHRLVSNLPQQAVDSFVVKAHRYFDIETLPFKGNNRKKVQSVFLTKIRAGAESRAMGAVVHGHGAFYVLRVKEGIMDRLFEGQIPEPLRRLDVTIVTKLVFQKILGFDDAGLDDEKRFLYTSRTQKAFEAVGTGKCPLALIINPTRLADMAEVSKAGLIMPWKSTYFFPKVLSGLVMNKIGD
jgi:uncharacterized protein (DUF1015 family)